MASWDTLLEVVTELDALSHVFLRKGLGLICLYADICRKEKYLN